MRNLEAERARWRRKTEQADRNLWRRSRSKHAHFIAHHTMQAWRHAEVLRVANGKPSKIHVRGKNYHRKRRWGKIYQKCAAKLPFTDDFGWLIGDDDE